MKIADESKVTINGTRYILIKDRNHEVGEGFALVIDKPDKAQERSFIPLEVAKALYLLFSQKKTA